MLRPGRKENLLVVGGATLAVGPDGSFVTKTAVADYLHELAQQFGGCTWVAARQHGPPRLTGTLESGWIRVVPVETRGVWGRVKAWARLAVLCLTRPYVLLYLPHAFLPVLPLVRLCARRLVVYLANDYEMALQQNRNLRSAGWAWGFRLSYELSLRLADAVLARGRRLARLARKFNPVVYETVPIGHMRAGALTHATGYRSPVLPAPPVHRILYVGKLLWSKGLGELIGAFRELQHRNSGRRFQLDLVGEGAARTALEKVAASELACGSIRFHGWVDTGDELDSFFRCAHVLVVPSTTYPEGVPRVIDEAHLRGLPVIATRVGGMAEEFSADEVLLVEPEQLAELARALEAILLDESVQQRYRAGAERRRARWLASPTAAQQHAQLLRANDSDVTLRPTEPTPRISSDRRMRSAG